MENNFLWWRDGVIYQIYPRSFSDSNNDGFGDLLGIISKLEYLSELGVDAIWLSPIYPSPDKDFGYDIADYFDIDPRFGTMADFDLLLHEAHKRNIHIVLDLVLNHISDQSTWFQASKSSRDNPYRDWFIWRENPKGKQYPPNNWHSNFWGSAWKYDKTTEQYYYYMFLKEEPDLNWRNPDVYKKMMDVFKFWLNRGVDGFRLDVFNEYFKDDQFRDNPPKLGIRPFEWQKHIFDVNRPEMMGALKDIRAILDSYPERYAVGETFLATTSEEAAKYVGPDKLHAAFDFTFLECPWNSKCFSSIITRWNSLLSRNDGWPNYVLNNHDQPRSATRYGKREEDERMKVAAAMLLTLRGTPFLYYGEEIGMRDIKLKRNEILDPVGKHYWPFFVSRDGCRSPMQWDSSENAGFSKRKPWLKVHPNYLKRNVKNQKEDPNSLLNFYKNLLTIRKTTPALQKGSFVPVTSNSRRLLAYIRQDVSQTVLVVLNFSHHKARLAMGSQLRGKDWQLLLSNKRSLVPEIKNNWLPLVGDEASLYIYKNKK